MNKDPWLKFAEVQEAEKKLEDLKDERRDANAKLEFDLSTSLTKEISAQERLVKRTIKKAKKAHKKGLTSIPIEEKKEKGKKDDDDDGEDKKDEKKDKKEKGKKEDV